MTVANDSTLILSADVARVQAAQQATVNEQIRALDQARTTLEQLTHSADLVEQLRAAPALLVQIRRDYAAMLDAAQAHTAQLAIGQDLMAELADAPAILEDARAAVETAPPPPAPALFATPSTLDLAPALQGASPGNFPAGPVGPGDPSLTAMSDQLPGTLVQTSTPNVFTADQTIMANLGVGITPSYRLDVFDTANGHTVEMFFSAQSFYGAEDGLHLRRDSPAFGIGVQLWSTAAQSNQDWSTASLDGTTNDLVLAYDPTKIWAGHTDPTTQGADQFRSRKGGYHLFSSVCGQPSQAHRVQITSSDQFDTSQFATSLSGTITVGGGALTSLSVSAIPTYLPAGATITVAQGGNTQTWTTTAQVLTGATSIPVQSQTPNNTYTQDATVTVAGIDVSHLLYLTASNASPVGDFMRGQGALVGTLSSALSVAGGAITTLPVNALQQQVTNGTTIIVTGAGRTQNWTASVTAAVGATSITVNSQTPVYPFPTGSRITFTSVLENFQVTAAGAGAFGRVFTGTQKGGYLEVSQGATIVGTAGRDPFLALAPSSGGAWIVQSLTTDSPANQLRFQDNSTAHPVMRLELGAPTDSIHLDTNGNLGLFGKASGFSTGVGIMFLANATTTPTGTPVTGGYLYINAGALTYKGSSGTVTVVAPA